MPAYGTLVLKRVLWRLVKIAIAFCVIFVVVYGVAYVIEWMGFLSGDTRLSFAQHYLKVIYLLTGIYAFFVLLGKW